MGFCFNEKILSEISDQEENPNDGWNHLPSQESPQDESKNETLAFFFIGKYNIIVLSSR